MNIKSILLFIGCTLYFSSALSTEYAGIKEQHNEGFISGYHGWNYMALYKIRNKRDANRAMSGIVNSINNSSIGKAISIGAIKNCILVTIKTDRSAGDITLNFSSATRHANIKNVYPRNRWKVLGTKVTFNEININTLCS